MINASNEGTCVEFEKTTTLVFLLSNCRHILQIFVDWRVKYYFWQFRYM